MDVVDSLDLKREKNLFFTVEKMFGIQTIEKGFGYGYKRPRCGCSIKTDGPFFV